MTPQEMNSCELNPSSGAPQDAGGFDPGCRYAEESMEPSSPAGNPDDGPESDIQSVREKIELSTEDDPALPKLLESFTTLLDAQYLRTPNLRYVDESIQAHRRLVRIAPEGYEGVIKALERIGTALLDRYFIKEDPQDIDAAVLTLQDALSKASAGDGRPVTPTLYHNLAAALRSRYTLRGDAEDINLAISNWKEAVRILSDEHPALAVALCSLGQALQIRSERTRAMSDVEESIVNLKRAIALINADKQPLAFGIALQALGGSYQSRWKLSQDLFHKTQAEVSSRENGLIAGGERFQAVRGVPMIRLSF